MAKSKSAWLFNDFNGHLKKMLLAFSIAWQLFPNNDAAPAGAASPRSVSAAVRRPPSRSSASVADRATGRACGRRERQRSQFSSQPASSRAGTTADLKPLVAARLTFSEASVSIWRTRSPEDREGTRLDS